MAVHHLEFLSFSAPLFSDPLKHYSCYCPGYLNAGAVTHNGPRQYCGLESEGMLQLEITTFQGIHGEEGKGAL